MPTAAVKPLYSLRARGRCSNFGNHTLKLEEVRALFINIWSFSFQDFIQALAL